MSKGHKDMAVGERIICRAAPHWNIYLSAFITALSGIVVNYYAVENIWKYASYLLILVAVLEAAIVYFRENQTEIILTNKRVSAQHGWFGRYHVEMYLNAVESVLVDIPFWGRVFNYGTIVISGRGGNKINIGVVANPHPFRKEALNYINHSI